ncbi:protein SUPPRESSOR OF PHYA-105 1 isoform X1 [Ricinus communis]|nr:protein SUPPRESSOR OF PHYA-105 1 isoform X1 [Ricinus communis]
MIIWKSMEGIGEEVIANDRAGNAELQGKGCEVSLKLEDRDVLDSHIMCASLRSVWPPESSINDYIDSRRLVNNVFSRCVLPLVGSEPPQISPCSINDVGNVVELTVGNYRTPNLALVSRTVNFQGGKWQHHVSEMPTGFKYKALEGTHDTKEISACLRTSDKIIVSSCTLPDGDLATSSSSQREAINKLLKGKGKGAVGKYGDALPVFNSAVLGHRDGKLGYARKVASDALMRASAKRNQISSHRIAGCGPESLNQGIILSDWLKPVCRRRDKAQSLLIFRHIVELVDLAHSQGVALQDLRPSCFNILPSNRIVYTGSTVKRESDTNVRHDLVKKRPMEQDANICDTVNAKQRKLNKGVKSIGSESQFASSYGFRTMAMNENNFRANGAQDSGHVELQFQSMKTRQRSLSLTVQLEEKWYKGPEQLNEGSETFSSNIYSLGVLLFELLSWFESHEMRSIVMSDLCRRILPSNFLSENPKEAGFCVWFLHPEPSSRPTARKILESELLCSSQKSCSGSDASACADNTDAESEVLHHFLNLMKDQKQTRVSKLIEDIECLEEDIKEVEKRHFSRICSVFPETEEAFPDAREQKLGLGTSPVAISRSSSVSNTDEVRLMRNINQIGNAYFSMRSQVCLTPAQSRSDKDFLKNRERWSAVHNDNEELNMTQKSEDPLGAFFEGFCKFARYSKFEVCGSLKNRDLLSSTNVLCSLSFDRDEEYIAAAGISKKIKVFEFATLLNDSIDIHYPVVEMSNKSKLSCLSWNNYIKNYLASTDYDGVIQMWDAGTGQGLSQYTEHQKRAWSVDFSLADPTMFASGSDDCSVKLWSINERGSLGTIWNPANICCVQFSASSTHLLAFGSADYKIYCYDLRHTRLPWCTLSGHEKAVSYVKFLDSETIVSASTDNTLRLWDLKKTSSTGLSSSACPLTFGGHTNEKNFVGLSTLDGYIACGSETNEVYCYYRSLPMPITSYKFGYVDPFSGNKMVDDSGQFVSSVCWRQKSNMVVAANSMGNMQVLNMV